MEVENRTVWAAGKIDERGLFIIPDDWQEVGEPVDFAKADTFYPEN